MPTELTFNSEDLASADADELRASLVAARLSPVFVRCCRSADGQPTTTVVSVHDSVSAGDIATAVANNTPAARLSVDVEHLRVLGDGSSTGDIAVIDSRGSAVTGRTCKLLLSPGVMMIPVSSSAVFDGNGRAVFTIGPTLQSGASSAPFRVHFHSDPDDAVWASALVEFAG